MRKFVLAATALTAVAGSAQAVDVKLYGLVDKALMVHDDGQTQETTVVDNNLESTRFGVGGEQKLDNGLTASVLFEVEQASNPSNWVSQAGTGTFNSQANTPAGNTPTLSERIARVGVAGNWGGLYLGQQDTATNDVYGHDLAAAGSVMNADVAVFGGGLRFRRDAAGVFSNLQAGGTNLTPGVLAMGHDGAADVADSVRYNSPVYNGFNGSVSVNQGGTADAAARYAGKFGDFELDSAVGYKWINNNVTTATDEPEGLLLASASVKHASGLAATVAYTQQDTARKSVGVEDPSGYYAKVGYAWDAFGVAADYSKFENALTSTATDHELEAFGVGGEYYMGKGVTLGALYRNYDAKVAGVSNDKAIDVGAVNLKVKF